MKGFVDLHCHWIPGIDDGVKTIDESKSLLEGLFQAGFSVVAGTPHMRPGMFDNKIDHVSQVYEATISELSKHHKPLPTLLLGTEHFFDDIVFTRLLHGEGIPYGGGVSVLIELNPDLIPLRLPYLLSELRKKKLLPVIAHPERYADVWKDYTILDAMIDSGAALQLDLMSLVGKYGKKPEMTARRLLDEGYYHLACSDAHRPSDVTTVSSAIQKLFHLAGHEEAHFLLKEGPTAIIDGRLHS